MECQWLLTTRYVVCRLVFVMSQYVLVVLSGGLAAPPG